MLKRLCLGSLVVAAAGSAVLVAAAPAHSDRADWPEDGPPPHGHLHLTHAVIDGRDVVSFEGCRELANGQVVPRSAHHENLHVGRAGAAQRQAGNAVVPMAPITPFESCEDLAEAVAASSS